eukprot:scaffold1301_cov363-Pavlova_lutheri.AAC.5
MSPPSLISRCQAHALYSALHIIGEWDTNPIKCTRDQPRDVHMGCTPRQDSITSIPCPLIEESPPRLQQGSMARDVLNLAGAHSNSALELSSKKVFAFPTNKTAPPPAQLIPTTYKVSQRIATASLPSPEKRPLTIPTSQDQCTSGILMES